MKARAGTADDKAGTSEARLSLIQNDMGIALESNKETEEDAGTACVKASEAEDREKPDSKDVKLELKVQKLADDTGIFVSGGNVTNTGKDAADKSVVSEDVAAVPVTEATEKVETTQKVEKVAAAEVPIYPLSTTNFVYLNNSDFDQLSSESTEIDLQTYIAMRSASLR